MFCFDGAPESTHVFVPLPVRPLALLRNKKTLILTLKQAWYESTQQAAAMAGDTRHKVLLHALEQYRGSVPCIDVFQDFEC